MMGVIGRIVVEGLHVRRRRRGEERRMEDYGCMSIHIICMKRKKRDDAAILW
jgi:hypothetical protein